MPASSLTRRTFLAAQAALLSPATRPRPNVILLVTDDQGYGDLGCYGNPYVKWEEMKMAGFGKWTRIPIGTSGENPTGLTCFDWYGEHVPSNQQMVSQAMLGNGTWALRAERGGRYQITLRQRPAYVNHNIDGERASVRINRRTWTKPIESGAGAVTIDVDLAPGDVDLWTEIARARESRGAYYVDVRHA